MIELTRLFYNKEEVIYSFKSGLLKQRDILECYYWAFELLYSEIDLFEIIWEIYYDYYALLNPHLEKYISKKQTEWEADNSEEHICYIIKNLFGKAHSYEVYMMRNYILTGCQTLTISKPSALMKDYLKKHDKKWHNLLTAINKGLINSVCYYLSDLMSSPDTNYYELYKAVCLFIVDSLNLDASDEKKFARTTKLLWNRVKYSNKTHYMLAVIYQIYISEEVINKKKIYIAPDTDEIEFVTGLNALKVKGENLVFEIDENIYCVKTLDRFKFPDYKQEIMLHWLFYAYHSSYWKSILSDKVELGNPERKEIRFINSVVEVEFLRTYAPNFDELYNMAPVAGDWIYYIYGEEPEITCLTGDLNNLSL